MRAVIIKFPHLYWVLNPQPLAYETSAITIIQILQVIVKGVKVCAQQSMFKHLPGGSLH